MARPTDSTSRRTRRLTRAAALAALALLLLPAASQAAPAAVDEYSFAPLSGQYTKRDDVQRQSDVGAKALPDQLGVVGENSSAESPLETILSSAGTAAWAGLGALLLGTALLLVADRRPRSAP